jgi:hypothetical protein
MRDLDLDEVIRQLRRIVRERQNGAALLLKTTADNKAAADGE